MWNDSLLSRCITSKSDCFWRQHDKTTCFSSLTTDKSCSQANSSLLLPGRHPADSSVTKHSSASRSSRAPCRECPPWGRTTRQNHQHWNHRSYPLPQCVWVQGMCACATVHYRNVMGLATCAASN